MRCATIGERRARERSAMTRFAHELAVGDEYAPLAFEVTADLNQQFLYALEIFHPRYIEGADGYPPLVHPVVLLHYSPRTRSPSFALAPGMGSVFARDHTRFLHPALVGDTFHTTWRITGVYEKRGRIYQDYVAEVRDAAGAAVLWREMTSVFVTRDPP
jgi:hypothetical protein